jgi:DNA-binding NarL/FixJ family response regulator
VIVSDDNPGIVDRICVLLGKEFELAATAQNGRTLVTQVQQHQPDVVVLDISMPLMNGIEAARKIRATGSNVKLIFLSLHEDPAFVRACFNEGASGYVIKYQLEPDLIPAIREALAGNSFVSRSAGN